ncbi:hypothetical protein N2152v2_002368 [Parachlorella kessleri]
MDPKRPAHAQTPPVKVVGFHVEGSSPSPRPTTLADAGREVSTSPSPVIIPPLFQGQRGEGPNSPVRTPSAPPGMMLTGIDDTSGLRPIKTSSEEEASGRTPVISPTSRGATPRPLPITPVMSAPPTLLSGAADHGGGAGATLPPLSPRVLPGATPTAVPASPAASAPAAAAAGPAGGVGAVLAAGPAAGTVGSPFATQLAQQQPQQPQQAQQETEPRAAAAQQQQQQQQQTAPQTAAAQQQAARPAKQPAQHAQQQQQQQGQQQQQPQPQQQKAQQQKPAKEQRPVEVPPKKELSRAERRAIQEAQRAAKAAAKAGQEGGAAAARLPKQGSAGSLAKQGSSVASKAAAAAGGAGEGKPTSAPAAPGAEQPQGKQGRQKGKEEAHATRSTDLFAHLPPYRKLTLESVMDKGVASSVPLEAVKLGLQYMDGSIRGANARCAAMLAMFMHVIKEFKMPAGRQGGEVARELSGPTLNAMPQSVQAYLQEFKMPAGRQGGEVAKELMAAVNGIVAFLVACRPLSVTMGNAIKYVKCELERLKLQPSLGEQQVKEEMCEKIGTFIQEKIRAADNLIIEHAIAKIQDGDVILTYSHSTLVAAVLLRAAEEGRRFSVVVADARPHLEGRRLLRQLLSGGIPCEYLYLNALSFSLDRVTKVFLGAGAVLSNGTVLSRVGSAAVAMMAAAERIPVLVCSETYKFHERVQLDSITQNELGDPEAVAQLPDWVGPSPLASWRDTERLGLLNLKYDAMPADFVSVVVTEAGLIPPTSVAVILRESRQDVL